MLGIIGFFKGVVLYYKGLINNGCFIFLWMGVGLDDIYFNLMLMFYMFGCGIVIFGCV